MGTPRFESAQSGYGEIGAENLVSGRRTTEMRRVAESECRLGRSDEIRVNVLRLITIVENKILEERIGGQRI